MDPEEVLEAALREELQVVTRRGETEVVVLTCAAFEELKYRNSPLGEALAGAPGEPPTERDPTPVPDVTLD